MAVTALGRENVAKLFQKKCQMILLNYQHNETNHDETSSCFIQKKNYCYYKYA